VVIINWWTLFWQPPFFLITAFVRRKGIKVVYACHSVYDHDASGWKMYLSKLMLRKSDGYILHSSEELGKLNSFTKDPVTVLRPMPLFGQFPKPNKKMPRRGRLEVLFFGFIRPYKGLGVLIDAFELLNDPDVYLTVVGEAWNNDGDKIKELAAAYENVEARIEYVDDAQAASYFERADVIAAPYITATSSAAIATAYKYKKPVLATSVGSLVDVVTHGKTGWLVPASDPKAIAEFLRKIDRKECRNMAPAITKHNRENTWDNLALSVIERFI
jgi:glycosyltransferase involved in cell wall biosynthesis